MRKVMAMMLAVSMFFTLSACGSKETPEEYMGRIVTEAGGSVTIFLGEGDSYDLSSYVKVKNDSLILETENEAFITSTFSVVGDTVLYITGDNAGVVEYSLKSSGYTLLTATGEISLADFTPETEIEMTVVEATAEVEDIEVEDFINISVEDFDSYLSSSNSGFTLKDFGFKSYVVDSNRVSPIRSNVI